MQSEVLIEFDQAEFDPSQIYQEKRHGCEWRGDEVGCASVEGACIRYLGTYCESDEGVKDVQVLELADGYRAQHPDVPSGPQHDQGADRPADTERVFEARWGK